VHSRIVVGVGAWLLGAATATGGSLLAVSLLGQGITGTGGLLLTQDQVNRALASDSANPATSAALPSGTPSATQSGLGSGSPAPSVTVPASPEPPSSSPLGTASTAPTGGTAPSAAVLTSRGGDVVASCLAAGAYLNSWSPLSGYEIGDVRRGPAATARVTFESAAGSVTMVVSCSSGVPSATTYSGSGHDY
jgi:hypothetical protein